MVGEQGFHIPQAPQGNWTPARRVVAHLDTDKRNRARILRHLRLQRFPVNVAFVLFLRIQAKDLRMRRLPGGEAFVDLMKDGAGKRQILEYEPFLRPRFEENVLGLLPGGGEDKMGERKYCPQTVIHIRGLLKSRM